MDDHSQSSTCGCPGGPHTFEDFYISRDFIDSNPSAFSNGRREAIIEAAQAMNGLPYFTQRTAGRSREDLLVMAAGAGMAGTGLMQLARASEVSAMAAQLGGSPAPLVAKYVEMAEAAKVLSYLVLGASLHLSEVEPAPGTPVNADDQERLPDDILAQVLDAITVDMTPANGMYGGMLFSTNAIGDLTVEQCLLLREGVRFGLDFAALAPAALGQDPTLAEGYIKVQTTAQVAVAALGTVVALDQWIAEQQLFTSGLEGQTIN